MHLMGWSMEGLPGRRVPTISWHPSGVDLVGTPGLMGVDGSDSLPLVMMGGPPKDPW